MCGIYTALLPIYGEHPEPLKAYGDNQANAVKSSAVCPVKHCTTIAHKV